MRNPLRYLWLALVLAAAPAQLMAQQQGQQDRSPDRSMRRHHGKSPVQMLLRERAELGLTDVQVVRLREIEEQMEERNRPFVRQLVEMRRALPAELRGSYREMTPEQRAVFHERMKAARPLIERIHENNRGAMRELGEVLTAEQKTRVRKMVHQKWGSKEHGRSKPDRKSGGRPQ